MPALSTLLAHGARLVLLAVLVVAPWPFGGYPMTWQAGLFGGVWASLLLWWLSALVRPSTHPEGGTVIVDALLPPVLFLMLAAVQLLPIESPQTSRPHAVLHHLTDPLEEDRAAPPERIALSASPAATRLTAARILLAMAAMFLGVQLFRDAEHRSWLYAAVVLSGAAIAAFGVYQKLTWNGMLFGVVPLRFGGQPFGPFVNRNNAAGYLNMAIAAAAAWTLLSTAPRMTSTRPGGRSFEPPGGAVARDHAGALGHPLAAAAALAVLVIGVLASMSRGGILALAASGLVAGWVLVRARRARLLFTGLLIVIPVAALGIISTGAGEALLKRLNQLAPAALESDIRLAHWRDTWGAVLDAPILGSGLGGYRYIQAPYQNHTSNGRFVNADNQFFEFLVECGWLGLGLVLTFVVLFALDVWRMHRGPEAWRPRDAGLLGAMLLASQVVQGGTDYGVMMTANLLTGAVLAGAVFFAAARAAPFLSGAAPEPPLMFRHLGAGLIGIVLLASAGYAWWEVFLAARVFHAIDPLPPVLTSETLSPERLERAIVEASEAADLRPDDSELQHRIGELWLYRYRLGALAAIDSGTKKPQTFWPYTQPERLFVAVANLEKEGNLEALGDLRRDPIVAENLPRARLCFRRALAATRWFEGAAEMEAQLTLILEGDVSRAEAALRRAAATSPNRPEDLVRIGVLATRIGRDELSSECFKQALRLDPQQQKTIDNARAGSPENPSADKKWRSLKAE